MSEHTNPSTAVVILNWNGRDLLEEFLPSVIETTNPALGRVIVADNGSTDDSLAYLDENFKDKVDVISFPKNYGFAGGYNHAIHQLRDKYEYIVLLNSDVQTAPMWLDKLVEFMDKNPKVGACQPKILSYKEPDKFEYAGAAGGFIDRNGYPYCRGRVFSKCETDNGQYDEPMSIFWATGAALMVRTKVYIDAGMLDENFFAHMEEIDLCWRILLIDFEIYAVPSSVVYHLGGGSLPASNPRKTYLNFRNNLLLLYKNLPDTTRPWKLFRRRLLDTIAWAKFVLSFDFKNAGAVWNAHRDYRKMRHNYGAQPEEDLLDLRADTHVNILTSYYLLHRTRFSSLRFKH